MGPLGLLGSPQWDTPWAPPQSVPLSPDGLCFSDANVGNSSYEFNGTGENWGVGGGDPKKGHPERSTPKGPHQRDPPMGSLQKGPIDGDTPKETPQKGPINGAPQMGPINGDTPKGTPHRDTSMGIPQRDTPKWDPQMGSPQKGPINGDTPKGTP